MKMHDPTKGRPLIRELKTIILKDQNFNPKASKKEGMMCTKELLHPSLRFSCLNCLGMLSNEAFGDGALNPLRTALLSGLGADKSFVH